MQTTIGLEEIRVFVIPSWIFRALERHKLSTRDLMDYGKIREVLSLNDMTEWFCLNDQYEIDKCKLSTELMDQYFHSATEEQKKEMRHSIVTMSYDDVVKNAVNTRLSNQSVGFDTKEEPYRFVSFDQTLFVVLNEGFNLVLKNHQEKVEFIRSYLKHCYAMTTVPFVSRFGVFKLYVKELQYHSS